MPPAAPGSADSAGTDKSAAGEPGDQSDASEGDAGERPSDDVLLEEPEPSESTASEDAADGDGADGGEQAVLDDALEAMESVGAQSGGDGDSAPVGEAGLDDVRAAMERAQGGGAGGNSELDDLNRELNESLAEFDGALINARQTRQGQRDDAGDAGYGDEETDAVAVYDDPMADPSGGADTGEGTYAPPMPAGGGGSGGGGGVPDGGGSGTTGSASSTASNVPADIPSGSDDDVVARQIREAAMNETDPELREKLWDEYRKYTNAQKRGS